MTTHLLDLPPELRLCIYEYVFGGDDLQEAELTSAFTNQPETALLRTCRAICNEAQPTHARYTALYRKKPFKIILNLTHDSSSHYIKLIKKYGRLRLPTTVRSLRCTWTDSAASMHFKVDAKGEVEVLVQQGVCAGSLDSVMKFGLWSDFFKGNVSRQPFVIERGGKWVLDTSITIGWVFNNCMSGSDGVGRTAFVRALRTSKARKWRRMYDRLVQAGRVSPRKRIQKKKVTVVTGLPHPATRARLLRERLFRGRILRMELFR